MLHQKTAEPDLALVYGTNTELAGALDRFPFWFAIGLHLHVLGSAAEYLVLPTTKRNLCASTLDNSTLDNIGVLINESS